MSKTELFELLIQSRAREMTAERDDSRELIKKYHMKRIQRLIDNIHKNPKVTPDDTREFYLVVLQSLKWLLENAEI